MFFFIINDVVGEFSMIVTFFFFGYWLALLWYLFRILPGYLLFHVICYLIDMAVAFCR